MTPNTGALNADLNLWMAASGLRGTLMDSGAGLTLTGVTDALVVGASSVRVLGAKGKLSAADAMVTRLRLGPVLAWTWGAASPSHRSWGWASTTAAGITVLAGA